MPQEKHPWESNDELQRGRVSKEDVEKLIAQSKKNEEKKVVKSNPYYMKNGIPHKMVNGKYVPLKRV